MSDLGCGPGNLCKEKMHQFTLFETNCKAIDGTKSCDCFLHGVALTCSFASFLLMDRILLLNRPVYKAEGVAICFDSVSM